MTKDTETIEDTYRRLVGGSEKERMKKRILFTRPHLISGLNRMDVYSFRKDRKTWQMRKKIGQR